MDDKSKYERMGANTNLPLAAVPGPHPVDKSHPALSAVSPFGPHLSPASEVCVCIYHPLHSF